MYSPPAKAGGCWLVLVSGGSVTAYWVPLEAAAFHQASFEEYPVPDSCPLSPFARTSSLTGGGFLGTLWNIISRHFASFK
jgi:hypothetical protein